MTVVRPFRAVRYDSLQVELSRVIAPPYDVVAPDEREGFFERDPHNAIRLVLTRDAADEKRTDYAEIAALLARWRTEGVLLHDAEPGFYVMREIFEAPDGRRLERVGFFAELVLAEYEEGVVRPHERTLAGPKADRLKVLRAARANLSSVFLLYEDRERELAALLESAFDERRGGRVLGSAKEEAAAIEYTLACLREPTAVARLQRFVADRSCVIADGHHRYETALAYRRERREAAGGAVDPQAPWESTLGYFTNAWAPGSLLLPIHRVILDAPAPDAQAWRERLPGWQSRTLPLAGAQQIDAVLAEELAPLAGRPAFLADDGSGHVQLFWKDEALGERLLVRVVESEVIGGVFGLSPEAIRTGAVHFPKSAERAAREVREGGGSVALYLNPLLADDVFRATERGEVMPQKSTFFYPKLPTGMVFRVHRDPA